MALLKHMELKEQIKMNLSWKSTDCKANPQTQAISQNPIVTDE